MTSPTSPTSIFPSPITSLRRPSHTPVRSTVDLSAGYNNYLDAFSEATAYDSSVIPSSPSSLTRNKSTRQIEAFGSKFLNAISESVRAPPAAAGLSRTKSLHARAKSLASFIPSLNPSIVEEQEGSSARPHVHRAFASSPVTGSLRRPSTAHLEKSIVEDEDQEEQYDSPFIMDYKSTLTGGLQRSSQCSQPSQPSTPTQTTARSSLPVRPSISAPSFRNFSWFGGSKQQPHELPEPYHLPVDLTNADLLQPANSLLFPHGTLDPQDPASFNDLLKNAELLITRLQTAYKQQEIDLKAARQENEVVAEEAEESHTRARHLKLQLDNMGRKARDQESAIKVMADELAAERLKRVEDNERWGKLQRRTTGEDEPTPKRRVLRNSAASSNSMSSIASDSGIESDYYAETETDAASSRPMTPLYEQQQWNARSKDETRPTSRGSMQDRTCHVDVGVWTWMRAEKGRLELRVRELEGIVEGALDLVS